MVVWEEEEGEEEVGGVWRRGTSLLSKLWGAGHHGQVESLTGVTHVLNVDAGV